MATTGDYRHLTWRRVTRPTRQSLPLSLIWSSTQYRPSVRTHHYTSLHLLCHCVSVAALVYTELYQNVYVFKFDPYLCLVLYNFHADISYHYNHEEDDILKLFFTCITSTATNNFHINEWQNSDIKGSMCFLIEQGLFFSADTCWPVQLWLCANTLEWYDFNAIHVFDPTWSPGWRDPKRISVTKTNLTENISNKSCNLI